MISKIYGLPNCYKCKEMQQKHPNVKYIIMDYAKHRPIIEEALKKGVMSAPILVDENNNIIRISDV